MESKTPEFIPSKFTREDRYIVVKRTDLAKTPASVQEMGRYLERISNSQRVANGKQPLECVVVEKDWAEYEIVWALIEARMKCRPVEGEFGGYRLVAVGDQVVIESGATTLADIDALVKETLEGKPLVQTSVQLSMTETALGMARDLLREVSQNFTRDDGLPNDLLPRIDAFLEPITSDKEQA